VFSIVALLAGTVVVSAAGPRRAAHPARRHASHSTARKARPRPLECGDLATFQILLDRQGFSPGEIDGRTGPNFTHALAAFQASKNLPETAQPDCATWDALGGDAGEPATTTYTVSDADMRGPFTREIPARIEQQAGLEALNYRSPLEALAERFHESPALIQKMNPGVAVAAGAVLTVPAVEPFDPAAKADPALAHQSIALEVSRDESALRAIREDGSVVFFAPVTTGSVHDPLPIGSWTVTAVQWHPVFHYNPQLFWDAKATDGRATIQAGPNNPVGVVWIAIDKEHYGLHGTPEPGRIGHTESHGCVRLTNWDAARVASLVAKGTPVVFK